MFSYFPKVTQEVGNTSGIPTYISVTPETILLISEGMRMKEVEAEPDLPYEKKKKGSGQTTPMFQEFPCTLPKRVST